MRFFITQPTASSANRPPAIPGHTSFLDGLRGLAAVYVLLHHARYLLHEGYTDGYLTHPESYSAFDRVVLYALSGFRWGHEAVLLFFVLSGFVIHLRYACDRIATPVARFDLGDFLRRRWRRLYPPLVVTLALTYVVDSAGEFMGLPIYAGETPYRTINAMGRPDLGLSTLVGNLTFLMDCYVPCYGTNSPLWSLKYEWWFYVLYPAISLVARRSVLGASLAIVGARVLSNYPELCPVLLLRQVFSMLIVWWMGALVAEAYAHRMTKVLGAAAIAAIPLPVMLLMKDRFYIPCEAFGLSCAGVISAGLWWRMRGGAVHYLDGLAWLGRMSYSLYVSHMPLLYLGGGILMARSSDGSLPRGFGSLLLGVAVCMAVGYLLHLIAERPFTRSRTASVSTCSR